MVIGIPTANALLQIVGAQDNKYGKSFFRTPIIQAIGWAITGAATTIIILKKTKKTKDEW